MIASATLLVTPVVVAKESGGDESYLIWMVLASLLVVGVSTLLQVRRLGPVGVGAVLPMSTAAFAIPFCITVLVDGGPATPDYADYCICACSSWSVSQVAVRVAASRNADSERHSDNDTFHNTGLGGVCLARRCGAGGAGSRAFDGPCCPGHSCRTDTEGHSGDAVVDTGNRYRSGGVQRRQGWESTILTGLLRRRGSVYRANGRVWGSTSASTSGC